MSDKESSVYLLFLRGVQVPLRLFSTVDLLQVWLDGINDRRAGAAPWEAPILFYETVNEDDEIIAGFMASEIQGVIRGVVAPESQIDDMLVKVAESQRRR